MMNRKRILTVAAFSLIVLGLATGGIAWATGLIGSDPPPALKNEIASSGVTQVTRAARSPSGAAYVARGMQGGQRVVALAIGDAATRWVPEATLLRSSPMAANGGAGGTGADADWFAVAGFVSSEVARLVAVQTDGSEVDITVTDGAFAVDLDPDVGVTVVAFDHAGTEIARREFPTNSMG